MKNYVLIDSKLVAYFHFHRNSDFLQLTNTVATHISRVTSDKFIPIFLMDKGKSFRTKIAPEYKAQRKDTIKKQGLAYEKKVKEFNSDYLKLETYLRNYGKVLAVEGYEADDLASILLSNLKANRVILFTSDVDWIKFVKNYLPITKLEYYHLHREKLLDSDDVFREFGYRNAYHKLIVDSFCGVSKENIKGVHRLGFKTFDKMFSDDFSIPYVINTLQEKVDNGKSSIPEKFNSVRDMFEFNYELFKPLGWCDIDDTIQKEIKTQMSLPISKSKDKILNDSLDLFGRPYVPSPIESSFYKLK